jgi:hypothetical protein
MKPVTASKPSETSAGTKWLAHFAGADRDTATMLIDSLEIHDHVEIVTELTRELKHRVNDTSHLFPAGLISIRSLEDLPATEAPRHIAYDTFKPGLSFPALPGSEAEIGALSRGMVDNYPDHYLSPMLDIDQLRKREVRSLFLVTDYSGSGKQAKRFAETFIENSTIASWISYKLMKIHVLSYASSLGASTLLTQQKHVTFQTITSAKSSQSANWSSEQRDRIERLCVKYADSSVPGEALGYEGSFGLYLSNLRVPNNLPQILIRGTGPWPGLFPNRSMPDGFYQELSSYRPVLSLPQTLRNLGADDIADKLELSHRPVPGLRALAALHLLDYGMTDEQVWGMLQLPETDLAKLKVTLISLKFMDLDNRVTKAGRRELARARARSYKPARYHHVSPEPIDYVPTQLR